MPRLIDADVLKRNLEDVLAQHPKINGGAFAVGGIRKGIKRAISAVDEAPTLNYAPVKRGEWMPWYKEDKNHKTGFSRGLRQLGWWCRACHGRSGIRTNFCPNCGAKMDGKENA